MANSSQMFYSNEIDSLYEEVYEQIVKVNNLDNDKAAANLIGSFSFH